MRILVESLKRLYKKGRLTKEQIVERIEKGIITEEEYEYITGEKYSDGDTAVETIPDGSTADESQDEEYSSTEAIEIVTSQE